MRKILKAVGNAVVTCALVVVGIIFIAVVLWQNRGRQKQGDISLSEDYDED